ncbi:hypothetical protein JAAARDRAFT_259960 [Jaapia argillacea MUCL 33604]|uniref:Uncharacterized protein n=1 Tax=Jaapia argillacea MUCL 33604 TaxID=933084 RepID=A0A067PTP6_9AGAM|nr:hypothetical protein JAAARDRAFT_259960 [Jaapia argillacea MUCL 33604]
MADAGSINLTVPDSAHKTRLTAHGLMLLSTFCLCSLTLSGSRPLPSSNLMLVSFCRPMKSANYAPDICDRAHIGPFVVPVELRSSKPTAI